MIPQLLQATQAHFTLLASKDYNVLASVAVLSLVMMQAV